VGPVGGVDGGEDFVRAVGAQVGPGIAIGAAIVEVGLPLFQRDAEGAGGLADFVVGGAAREGPVEVGVGAELRVVGIDGEVGVDVVELRVVGLGAGFVVGFWRAGWKRGNCKLRIANCKLAIGEGIATPCR
jgi:hypothetical protein